MFIKFKHNVRTDTVVESIRFNRITDIAILESQAHAIYTFLLKKGEEEEKRVRVGV